MWSAQLPCGLQYDQLVPCSSSISHSRPAPQSASVWHSNVPGVPEPEPLPEPAPLPSPPCGLQNEVIVPCSSSTSHSRPAPQSASTSHTSPDEPEPTALPSSLVRSTPQAVVAVMEAERRTESIAKDRFVMHPLYAPPDRSTSFPGFRA